MGDKRPTIGLDLDGVCAQFSPKFVELANKRFGLNLDAKNQTDWDFQSLGLTDEQCELIYNQIYETDNFWLSLDKLPHTDALITEQRKYRLFFITSRMYASGMSLEDQAANWIRRNFFIANPTVIVASNKGEVAKALGLYAFLDDRFENCVDVFKNSSARVYLHDAPYNKHQGFGNRAASVNDFFKKIGGLYGIREAA
jgi:uncharacterized HAD superfamily protein